MPTEDLPPEEECVWDGVHTGPTLARQLACRKYYRKNCEKLKEKSRLRAIAVKAHETPEEAAARKERHRLAAAKYRQYNRKLVNEKERKRRPGYRKWLTDHQKRADEGDEFSQWLVRTET